MKMRFVVLLAATCLVGMPAMAQEGDWPDTDPPVYEPFDEPVDVPDYDEPVEIPDYGDPVEEPDYGYPIDDPDEDPMDPPEGDPIPDGPYF